MAGIQHLATSSGCLVFCMPSEPVSFARSLLSARRLSPALAPVQGVSLFPKHKGAGVWGTDSRRGSRSSPKPLGPRLRRRPPGGGGSTGTILSPPHLSHHLKCREPAAWEALHRRGHQRAFAGRLSPSSRLCGECFQGAGTRTSPRPRSCRVSMDPAKP